MLWCTILHKGYRMETVSLVQLGNDKRIQHFVIPLRINDARFGSRRNDDFNKE